jgi:acetoin utilization deacetylase AcuC-like enzyme
MTGKNETDATKSVYSKPRLEEIKLVAEEALLTACKTAASGPNRPIICSAPPGHDKCRNSVGS